MKWHQVRLTNIWRSRWGFRDTDWTTWFDLANRTSRTYTTSAVWWWSVWCFPPLHCVREDENEKSIIYHYYFFSWTAIKHFESFCNSADVIKRKPKQHWKFKTNLMESNLISGKVRSIFLRGVPKKMSFCDSFKRSLYPALRFQHLSVAMECLRKWDERNRIGVGQIHDEVCEYEVTTFYKE